MLVSANGMNYVVKFEHGSDSSLYPGCLVQVTGCHILRVTRGKRTKPTPGKGLAVCHPGDVFCKNEGRKRSLARALKAGGCTKPIRTKFWEAYFKLTQPKPQAK